MSPEGRERLGGREKKPEKGKGRTKKIGHASPEKYCSEARNSGRGGNRWNHQTTKKKIKWNFVYGKREKLKVTIDG